MKNVSERQRDILSIIDSLDISPTMYENAVAKYEAITNFLCDCGIEANMYPQGSFAFGTVVRPNIKNQSANYDLDFICQVKGSRDDYNPSELRNQIAEALSSSGIYGGKLTICNECFTIEYADINGVGFAIDIVPATDESSENKSRLIAKSQTPELIDTAIAIPKHNGDRNYRWLTNNPKGFRTWFSNINEPFLAAGRATFRQHLFEQNRSLYASIEEIPSGLERSALQRVIQILKYHRDVYYSMLDDGDDIKPISAIINTVVTRISTQFSPSSSVFELLEYVLGELEIYAQQQNLTINDFTQIYGTRSVFSRTDGKWYISNPANPEDNLADKWNINSRIPTTFFQWVSVAKDDLISVLHQEDDQKFRAILESGFGSTTVASILGKKYCAVVPPKPIVSQTVAKPYRRL
jgi:hypothetical protein